jgi:hypothetical protein
MMLFLHFKKHGNFIANREVPHWKLIKLELLIKKLKRKPDSEILDNQKWLKQLSKIQKWSTVSVREFKGYISNYSYIQGVQEECARLREGVPYIKIYRYNTKHLCPKLNGYEDNGQRKVWSSLCSTHYTYQLINFSVWPWLRTAT